MKLEFWANRGMPITIQHIKVEGLGAFITDEQHITKHFYIYLRKSEQTHLIIIFRIRMIE